MKRLNYLMLLVLGIGFLMLSCEKQDDALFNEETPTYKDKKINEKVRLCHYDEDLGDWDFISVSAKALKAHLKHGDYLAFPYEGTFNWNYVNGPTYSHTMTITEVSQGTFSGYGVANFNPVITWDVTGNFDQKGNVTFTIEYYVYGEPVTDFYCIGSVLCGEGTSGSVSGTNPATWYISAN